MVTHVHWHRLVATVGIHLYYECRCGSRRHGLRNLGGYSPVDRNWLNGGEWGGETPVSEPSAPPHKGKGRKRS